MNRRRAGLAAALLLLLMVAGFGWWTLREPAPPAPRPPAERPTLLLLTSLPLVLGEKFALDGGGSPALSRLEQRYRVKPIALADSASLQGQRLLLMAHPRAQTAEALVDLDAWVRGGGRLLLLADPLLEWPSERAFGDPLRPPPGFADTGLLMRWGLTLSRDAARGPVEEKLDGHRVQFVTPGSIVDTRSTTAQRIVRKPVGGGRVSVVADADWLADPDNLDALMAELDRLERPAD